MFNDSKNSPLQFGQVLVCVWMPGTTANLLNKHGLEFLYTCEFNKRITVFINKEVQEKIIHSGRGVTSSQPDVSYGWAFQQVGTTYVLTVSIGPCKLERCFKQKLSDIDFGSMAAKMSVELLDTINTEQ